MHEQQIMVFDLAYNSQLYEFDWEQFPIRLNGLQLSNVKLHPQAV